MQQTDYGTHMSMRRASDFSLLLLKLRQPGCHVVVADFAALGSECKQIVQQGADWLHIDVMVSLHR